MNGVTPSDLGMPLDLLAHWMYRQSSLYRDILDRKNQIDDFRRDSLRAKRNAIVSDFRPESDEEMIEKLRGEIYTLRYLEAEASYWMIRLDLETNALLHIGTAIKPPPPEPLSLKDVKRVQVYASAGKVFDSQEWLEHRASSGEIQVDMVESDPGLLGVIIKDWPIKVPFPR